eukprot:scaffold7146_cov115-Isochrysis_galbana.AAC.4
MGNGEMGGGLRHARAPPSKLQASKPAPTTPRYPDPDVFQYHPPIRVSPGYHMYSTRVLKYWFQSDRARRRRSPLTAHAARGSAI